MSGLCISTGEQLLAPRRYSRASLLPQDSLRNGLVAHWRLEGAWRDRSRNAFHLTDNNTVTTAGGVIGTAAQFTQANSEFLSHADHSLLRFATSSFSVALWAYFDSQPAIGDGQGLVAKNGPNQILGDRWFVARDDFATKFCLRLMDGTTSFNLRSTRTPSDSTWYSVIAWLDIDAEEAGIQVNDDAPDTNSTTIQLRSANTGTFNIGGNGSNFLYHDGRIDNVMLWNRVLTARERARLYRGGKGLAI